MTTACMSRMLIIIPGNVKEAVLGGLSSVGTSSLMACIGFFIAEKAQGGFLVRSILINGQLVYSTLFSVRKISAVVPNIRSLVE